jgi:ABC-type lipoprotein release transport system permease subunit
MDLWMYMKLAWRNVLRNKRRTFLAGLAVGIGLAALIFTDALIIGMENNMIASATSSFMGEAQIHRRGFRGTRDVDLTINHPDSVLAQLASDPDVKQFTPRVITTGMIRSADNTAALLMVGVDPSTEPDLSQIDEGLIDGEYFGGKYRHEILIGAGLADLLEAKVGDRLVVTSAQAHTGDLAQQMFRVAGIYRLHIKELDKLAAFVRIDVAQKMLGLGNGIHEIAITGTTSRLGRDPNYPFYRRYSRDGNEALGWTTLLPQLEAALEMSQFSTVIIGLILFGVVSLGIVNALFMSLYERMFEFGVMRAIGTHPFAMARLIVLEAAALAVISCVIGAIIGYASIAITGKIGIDYTGIEFAGVTFRRLLYPVMELKQFTVYPVAVILFTLVVALYPAAFAARLTPAEAMRRSL